MKPLSSRARAPRRRKHAARRGEAIERLEPRLALAVTVANPLPDIAVPYAATGQTISVAGRFDDAAVTGTLVQFNTNAASPNDRVIVELFDSPGAGRSRTTPATVANFLGYVDRGDYANTIIHRSVPGFVVQGGGFRQPTAASNQTGGYPATIAAQPAVVNEPGNTNVRGTIAMAKLGGDPDSATNQWFFNLADNSANLDAQNGGFTAFGRVLGSGMDAVDVLAAVPRFDFGGTFSDLPLRDVPTPLPNPFVIQPAQYVAFPTIRRIGEVVYSATSSDPALVTASFPGEPGSGELRLDHAAGRTGTAVIAVRAASVYDPTSFVEDFFTVTRQAPVGPGAPAGVAGLPGSGVVVLAWSAPASSGDLPVNDYVVEYSRDAGSTWTTFADGTSAATRATVTGLVNGTSYVFRVAAVSTAGTGGYSAVSPAIVPRSVVAVGTEVGTGVAPVVRLVEADTGRVIAEVVPFEPTFRGGAQVAMADIDDDRIPEVLVGAGTGRAAEVRIFRQQVAGGRTSLVEIVAARTLPFGPRVTTGVNVAGGDVDGDGREDLVAAMARGAGTVSVFRSVAAADPIENQPYRTFTPFPASFGGGANVAVADVGTFVAGRLTNAAAADGRVEIVVASGAGMRATVQVYDISAAARVVTTVMPFTRPSSGGATVAAGRVNDDAIDDIVVSAGRGGGSAVVVLDGRVDRRVPAVLVSSAAFAAYARPNAAVFSAAVDLDADGRVDRFLSTQGDPGGPAGLLHVAANGSRVGLLGSLRGPLKIAAARPIRRG